MFHPYGLGWGLIYFPERGKDISEKGGSWKEKGGRWCLGKTVRGVRMDFTWFGGVQKVIQARLDRLKTCGQAKVSRMVLGALRLWGVKKNRKEKLLLKERQMNWCRMSNWSNLWDLNQTNYFLMHEHYDQSLFCSGVKKHCLWWGEGLESALVVRLLGPGAGLGLWAAGDRTAPCLQHFNNWRLGQCTVYMDCRGQI